MEATAYERLRCPSCRGALTLEAFAEGTRDGHRYIENGILLCDQCSTGYPVESFTPVMLRFRTEFHDWFAGTHRDRLDEYARYALPAGSPRPGELAIQETFTDEWNLTREDELSFTYNLEELVELNKRVWLRSIVESAPEDGPRTVLDVGCGAGMETMALREATGAEELFGIDLNFALLSRREEYRRQPNVHYVISSLFDLPFEPESFDLVYSQGVIHHTYSTAEAFNAIAPSVRSGGHLFVWVYGLDDHLVPNGHRRKLDHVLERILRPLISRSPGWLRDGIFKFLVAFSHLRKRRGLAFGEKEGHGAEWSRANTEHTLRDWLSPRYAHRHGYNEVIEWFESGGFRVEDVQSAAAYRALFDDPPFGVGVTGERLEGAGAKQSASAVEHAGAA